MDTVRVREYNQLVAEAVFDKSSSSVTLKIPNYRKKKLDHSKPLFRWIRKNRSEIVVEDSQVGDPTLTILKATRQDEGIYTLQKAGINAKGEEWITIGSIALEVRPRVEDVYIPPNSDATAIVLEPPPPSLIRNNAYFKNHEEHRWLAAGMLHKNTDTVSLAFFHDAIRQLLDAPDALNLQEIRSSGLGEFANAMTAAYEMRLRVPPDWKALLHAWENNGGIVASKKTLNTMIENDNLGIDLLRLIQQPSEQLENFITQIKKLKNELISQNEKLNQMTGSLEQQSENIKSAINEVALKIEVNIETAKKLLEEVIISNARSFSNYLVLWLVLHAFSFVDGILSVGKLDNPEKDADVLKWIPSSLTAIPISDFFKALEQKDIDLQDGSQDLIGLLFENVPKIKDNAEIIFNYMKENFVDFVLGGTIAKTSMVMGLAGWDASESIISENPRDFKHATIIASMAANGFRNALSDIEKKWSITALGLLRGSGFSHDGISRIALSVGNSSNTLDFVIRARGQFNLKKEQRKIFARAAAARYLTTRVFVDWDDFASALPDAGELDPKPNITQVRKRAADIAQILRGGIVNLGSGQGGNANLLIVPEIIGDGGGAVAYQVHDGGSRWRTEAIYYIFPKTQAVRTVLTPFSTLNLDSSEDALPFLNKDHRIIWARIPYGQSESQRYENTYRIKNVQANESNAAVIRKECVAPVPMDVDGFDGRLTYQDQGGTYRTYVLRNSSSSVMKKDLREPFPDVFPGDNEPFLRISLVGLFIVKPQTIVASFSLDRKPALSFSLSKIIPKDCFADVQANFLDDKTTWWHTRRAPGGHYNWKTRKSTSSLFFNKIHSDMIQISDDGNGSAAGLYTALFEKGGFQFEVNVNLVDGRSGVAFNPENNPWGTVRWHTYMPTKYLQQLIRKPITNVAGFLKTEGPRIRNFLEKYGFGNISLESGVPLSVLLLAADSSSPYVSKEAEEWADVMRDRLSRLGVILHAKNWPLQHVNSIFKKWLEWVAGPQGVVLQTALEKNTIENQFDRLRTWISSPDPSLIREWKTPIVKGSNAIFGSLLLSVPEPKAFLFSLHTTFPVVRAVFDKDTNLYRVSVPPGTRNISVKEEEGSDNNNLYSMFMAVATSNDFPIAALLNQNGIPFESKYTNLGNVYNGAMNINNSTTQFIMDQEDMEMLRSFFVYPVKLPSVPRNRFGQPTGTAAQTPGSSWWASRILEQKDDFRHDDISTKTTAVAADPINDWGFSKESGRWRCCGLSPDHPGCWIGKYSVSRDPQPTDFLKGFSSEIPPSELPSTQRMIRFKLPSISDVLIIGADLRDTLSDEEREKLENLAQIKADEFLASGVVGDAWIDAGPVTVFEREIFERKKEIAPVIGEYFALRAFLDSQNIEDKDGTPQPDIMDATLVPKIKVALEKIYKLQDNANSVFREGTVDDTLTKSKKERIEIFLGGVDLDSVDRVVETTQAQDAYLKTFEKDVQSEDKEKQKKAVQTVSEPDVDVEDLTTAIEKLTIASKQLEQGKVDLQKDVPKVKKSEEKVEQEARNARKRFAGADSEKAKEDVDIATKETEIVVNTAEKDVFEAEDRIQEIEQLEKEKRILIRSTGKPGIDDSTPRLSKESVKEHTVIVKALTDRIIDTTIKASNTKKKLEADIVTLDKEKDELKTVISEAEKEEKKADLEKEKLREKKRLKAERKEKEIEQKLDQQEKEIEKESARAAKELEVAKKREEDIKRKAEEKLKKEEEDRKRQEEAIKREADEKEENAKNVLNAARTKDQFTKADKRARNIERQQKVDLENLKKITNEKREEIIKEEEEQLNKNTEKENEASALLEQTETERNTIKRKKERLKLEKEESRKRDEEARKRDEEARREAEEQEKRKRTLEINEQIASQQKLFNKSITSLTSQVDSKRKEFGQAAKQKTATLFDGKL